mgnify:CR=1 FL=1
MWKQSRKSKLLQGIQVGRIKYSIKMSVTGMYMATIYVTYTEDGEPDPKSGIEERGNYCSVCLFLEDDPNNFGEVIEPSTYDGDCDECNRAALPHADMEEEE